MSMTTPATLDDLERIHGDALAHLESHGVHQRWGHPSATDPDGGSTWTCGWCDRVIDDPTEGCECQDPDDGDGEFDAEGSW